MNNDQSSNGVKNMQKKWNTKIHLENEIFMSDHNQKRYPFIFRMLYKIPYFYRAFNQRIIRIKIK